MAKRTYSIRKGFEYQDIFCAIKLLEAIRDGRWSLPFLIESDEVHHIDDLVMYPIDSTAMGYQIKCPVTHGDYYSFNSFLEHPTQNSRSLIQKLYHGWNDWSDKEIGGCELTFVSPNFAEPGKGKLGSAILSASGKFSDDFYTTKFKRPRTSWQEDLDIPDPQLKNFLSNVTWHFGNGSLSTLRDSLESLMAECRLPRGDDAISAVLDVVAQYALTVKDRRTIKHFAVSLWERDILRESLEQILDEDDLPSMSRKPANSIKIATISLDSLPAFSCKDFVCLEEPLPLGDYQTSISNPVYSDFFDDLRSGYLDSYIAWQKHRIEAILNSVEGYAPDVIIFPRYSIPAELAADVSAWCRKKNINVVLGGHSQPDSTGISPHYSESLSLLPELSLSEEPDEGIVIDALIRAERAGRYSLSKTSSPYQRQEEILLNPVQANITCSTGWVNVLVIQSRAALDVFSKSISASPELIIASCNLHDDPIYDALKTSKALHNTPIIVASARPIRPISEILTHTETPSFDRTPEWEGISLTTIEYDRTADTRWIAHVTSTTHIPVVYAAKTNSDLIPPEYYGLSNSVSLAKSHRESKEDCLYLNTSDPNSFFAARAKTAIARIRSVFADLPVDSVVNLSKSLKAIEKELARRSEASELSQLVAAPPHAVKGHRRPPLVDRTKERNELGRFLDGTSGKRFYFLHGPPGVGKRSLIRDLGRTHSQRNTWLRFQCIANATLAETLGQLLSLLGHQIDNVPTVDSSLFQTVHQSLRDSEYTHLIIESAQHLPLRATDSEHSQLMAWLSSLVSTDMKLPVLMISDQKADLEFSGKHHTGSMFLQGLGDEDTVHLLQELIVDVDFSYDPPGVEDLFQIARSIHGMPLLAEIVASILENTPVDELIGVLHKHEKVRRYILEVLLGRGMLSPAHDRFLMLAAVMRTPIPISAFSSVTGAKSRRIADELHSRFLLTENDGLYELHPLVADYYRHLIPDEDAKKRLHKTAFKYYDALSKQRRLTTEEKGERVFHAFRSSSYLRLDDLALYSGPIRSAMFDGLRSRDWQEVQRSASQILDLFPTDALARTAMAVSLDARGQDSDLFFDSVSEIDFEHLWVGIELARSKIRRHDFQRADYLLSELRQRFASNNRIEIASAQLDQARGLYDEAIEKCEGVLASKKCTEADAFYAGLLLLSLKRLDLLVDYVNRQLKGKPKHKGLVRLNAYGSVITNNGADQGMAILANLWHSNKFDAHVVHDYALALTHQKQFSEAERVLDLAVQNNRWVHGGKANIHEAFAVYWDARGNYRKAHEHFRILLKLRPYETHVYRQFASSLVEAASKARKNQEASVEQACVEEAKHVLENLLEIAHEDRWASDTLHRVSIYNY